MFPKTVTRIVAIFALAVMVAAFFTHTAFSQATATPIAPAASATPLTAAQSATPDTAAKPAASDSAVQTPRTVTVSGSGSMEGAPDRALVSLGVTTDSQDAATALSENNTNMQALITALRNAGVAQADIRTLTVQLQPRYASPSNPSTNTQVTIEGFTATNMVQVTVRKLDNLGTLLDAAVKAGGNQIQGIDFEISDPSALLDQAREAAMQDARHKAEQLASLSGAQLGVVMTINESSSAPVVYARQLAVQAVGAPVPVSPGTQSVQVDLQVTWELR